MSPSDGTGSDRARTGRSTSGVHTSATLSAPVEPARLFRFVEDLGSYPGWMELVHRAEPVEGRENTWDVELRAKVGPFARSKQLRMVRTLHQRADVAGDPCVVRFERREDDGRSHAPWVLEAEVRAVDADPDADATDSGSVSRLVVDLHYGGSLWTGGLLERVLSDHIERGRDRLAALVSAPADS